MSNVSNLMTILGITMRNTFKQVQTYLVLVKFFVKSDFNLKNVEGKTHSLLRAMYVHTKCLIL